MIKALCVLLALSAVSFPQEATRDTGPLKLDKVLDYITVLPNPVNLYEAIRRTGIDFEVNEESLSRILTAARDGKQTDAFTARLITEIMHACVGCRDQYFGPLSMEELFGLIRRSLPRQILFDEVRLRQTKNIPPTEDSLRQLQQGGVPPELIELILPADQIEVKTPPGYQRLDLRRTADYSRVSPVGSLALKVDVQGMAELLFINNALFGRPLTEWEGKPVVSVLNDLGASYNTPAPSSPSPAEPTLLSVDRLEKKGGVFRSMLDKTKASVTKGPKVPQVKFGENLIPGRSGLHIIITETDKVPHTYDIRIQWNRPNGGAQ